MNSGRITTTKRLLAKIENAQKFKNSFVRSKKLVKIEVHVCVVYKLVTFKPYFEVNYRKQCINKV